MGPLRGVLLNKGTLSVEAKVRYCEALACFELFQQMEIRHDVGVSNENRIQAAYVGALRAAARMVHVANSEEHVTDDAVFLKVKRAGLDLIRQIRRLKYFERVINYGPGNLRLLLEVNGFEGSW
eukprot:1546359-Pyramimonas_sp.AAC.1